MRKVKLTTSFVAPLARRDKTTIYQWFNTPGCQSWLPPKTGIGESRTFTAEQAVLLMILSDLNRWGAPVPFAGKIVSQIAESLAAEPNAAEVHLQFHENGATFTEAHGEQPCVLTGVDNGAGPMRFGLAFDVIAYRAAVQKAIDAEVTVLGAEDDDA